MDVSLNLWLHDFYRRARLRRVLYADIGWMFSMAHSYYDSIHSSEDTHVFRHRYEQLKETLRFEGQDHLNAHRDVYVQLPEQPAAEHIFREFHRIADEPSGIAINCQLYGWWVRISTVATCEQNILQDISQKSTADEL